MRILPPEGFTELLKASDGRFRGIVAENGVVFEVESEPYRADWSCRLLADTEVLGTGPSDRGSESVSN